MESKSQNRNSQSPSQGQPEINLSWRQRTRYHGRFIAIFDNKIIASGNSYVDTRYKVRRKLAQQKVSTRPDVYYHFVERRTNFVRGMFLVLLASLVINYQLVEVVSESLEIHQKISTVFFIDLAILAVFYSTITMINPVIRSRVNLGLLGKALKNQERQVGWEVVSLGIIGYILLSSIVLQGWVFFEYNLQLRQTSLATIIISFLTIVQLWLSFREERRLKKLHHYLIDQITLEDRLTYDEIVNYLSEIPTETPIDRDTLYATLEASLESPFALTKVIAFRVLFRDIGIILACILVSFGVGYLLDNTGIVTDLVGARIFGSLMTAGLLLFYALIKRSTSILFAQAFVNANPTYTLRPGGLDRLYLKLFPQEVDKIKEETVLTILMVSVSLTAGLGFASLIYGGILFISIILEVNSSTIDLINSGVLSIGMIPLSLFIIIIARRGTKKWVSTVEKGILDFDERLNSSIGMTPGEIFEYLHKASQTKEQILRSSSINNRKRIDS
ncbi:MAG: hypothetical protein ACXAC7_02160 [Candidatus Hodarchaeales archaeon]|jgi:hypothetical protein